MAKQKQDEKRFTSVVELGPTGTKAQLENAIEGFEKKWGMELTKQETQQIIKRAVSKMLDSEEELEVKPAVRNEMFAMLIEKDPEKAISFRIRAYEKRGKKITDSNKRAVRNIAKTEGFRAARKELKSIMDAHKAGKGDKVEEIPVFKSVVKVDGSEKSPSKEKTVKSGGETEAEQAYRIAMQKNRRLSALLRDCSKELSALNREYYGKGGKISKSESEAEGEKLVEEFKKKRSAIQKPYLGKANALKKERDSYTAKYVKVGTRTMVGDEKMGSAAVKGFVSEQTRKMTEFEGATSIGAGYGIKRFRLGDLNLRGAAEKNAANFENQLKTWEAGRKRRRRG
jgi:hypothetical protein